MHKQTVRDIEVAGKKVLVRCDFNVPLNENREITDNRRIVGALDTIRYLLEHGAKVILCSHLGRPKGEVKPEFSLQPVAAELENLLGKPVSLAQDIVGDCAKSLVDNMQEGDIVLLENVRFDAREEKNDPTLSKELAALADIYVNDAFGTAHRAHSSTAGVADYLPAVCGYLIEKELAFLGKALENPERPFVAILGGKKVSDKIGVIRSLLEKVDTLIIGGAMANTFLKAQGYSVGTSLVEEDKLELAKELLEEAKQKQVKLVLPVDACVATELTNEAKTQVVRIEEVPENSQVLDIGTATIDMYKQELETANTVVWNGPVGAFEFAPFAKGTEEIAKTLADLEAITVIGGGDSAAAIEQMGLADKMTHISTGGGASLEFLEGKPLPGVECLMDK